MARLYSQGKPTDEIRKVYEKGSRRLRYNQNVLIAATWTWILVQRNEIDAAFKALTEALKNSDNAIPPTMPNRKRVIMMVLLWLVDYC